MTDRRIKWIGGGCKRLSFLAGLVLLLVPVSGWGDTNNLLTATTPDTAFVSGDSSDARQKVLDSAEAGNVIARFGGIAFSVNYGGGEAANAMQERVGLSSPVKKNDALGKLAFKIGFSF